tara:strand:- start:2663 stop:3052 length:390 start_codon:yes stop_codon:yes gene_type:complete
MSEKVTIKLKGNFFKNPDLKKAINKSVAAMALVTEARVKNQLYSGHGVQTGYLRRSVSGELISDLTAQIDAGAFRQGRNVNYADWVEGTSIRNRVSSFKGYKMFEIATRQLENENKDKYFETNIKDTLG